jgi:hypothetical protein
MADATRDQTEDKASKLRREEFAQELRMHCAQGMLLEQEKLRAWRSMPDALTETARTARMLLEQHSEQRQRKLEAMGRLLDELGTDDITKEDIEAIRAEWRR